MEHYHEPNINYLAPGMQGSKIDFLFTCKSSMLNNTKTMKKKTTAFFVYIQRRVNWNQLNGCSKKIIKSQTQKTTKN